MSRRSLVVGTALVAVVAVLGWWLATRRPPPDAAEVVRLEHVKNVALGHLENQDLPAAIPLLEELRAAVPRDPLGPRNLAVARVVALGDLGQAPDPALLAAAETALADLVAQEGRTPAFHWLAARVDSARGAATEAAAHYAAAAAAAPRDASAWYEQSRAVRAAARGRGDEAAGEAEADRLLDKAIDLQPFNLWLAVEFFRAASAALARDEPGDAGLAERIEARWPAVAPFAPSIKSFTRVDVRGLLDESLAALAAGQRGQAAARLRGLANVLAPQTEADRREIERHPLEFVTDRFTTLPPPPTATAAEPIPVAFAPAWEPPADVVAGCLDLRLEDFDLDGRTDLVVLCDAEVRVLTRDTTGGWREIAAAAVPAGSRGLVLADLDLDFDEARRVEEAIRSATDPAAAADRPAGCPAADLDIIVFGTGGVTRLENRLGDDVAVRTLVPCEADAVGACGDTTAATLADLDADGDLDLVTAGPAGIVWWTNTGGGGFTATTDAEPLVPPDGTVHALLPLDWDRDVDVDVIVVTEGQSGLLENLRHGQFRFVPFTADRGVAVSGPLLSADIVDADANGSWDLVAAGDHGVTLVTTQRTATGVTRPAAPPPAIRTTPCRGVVSLDFDNDGLLDLVSWGDGPLTIVRGLPLARFAPLDDGPTAGADARGCDSADVDGDGDLDLAVAAGGGVVLLENRGGDANHWLDVALEAQQIKGEDFSPSGRVNAHGLGSLLELKAGDRYQPRPVRRRTTHFGLGQLTAADVVRVLWINGVPQNVMQPAADMLVCEEQVLLGSCPYIYAWDGTGFRFVTDLLWAAPLGLQRAAGELTPAREWEHLLVRGSQLVDRDGCYELRLTEELWEAAYFDELRLVAVDHPADVTVETNEKVGPADIAAFHIHTVRTPRAPVAARAGSGRDLLPDLRDRDGRYAVAFDRKLRQGLTEPWALELDLGDLADPDDVVVFLTGWTYPTTVGQNVGLSQDPLLPAPVPPSVAVPDGRGGWRTVRPFMGFPGGKTKTIAVDLSGLLDPADPRLRIESSMEIAWDAVAFESGEAPAALETTDLELVSAELRFRGVSRIEQQPGLGPETFLYDRTITVPKWPPMQGSFTRFGDVRELLAESDDRLLVMAAGDEVALRFAAPPPPPPGWTRDFILTSVGWDKDANLATAVGQGVDPLPWRGMASYPPAADDPAPDSPDFRRYLDTYQTRTQSEAFWRVLRGPLESPQPAGASW